MSYKGFKIIDSDGHVMEPWSLLETYTEAPFQERARQLVAAGKERDGGVVAVINELHDSRFWKARRRVLGARDQWETAPHFLDAFYKGGGHHAKARDGAGQDPHNTIKDLWDPLESTCRHASLSIL